MRSAISTAAVFLGLALPQALAACPYARQNSPSAADQASPHSLVDRKASGGKKGVFYLNRIAPGTSELYVADADGSNERPLLSDAVYEYHAAFSPDGEWITFTSERNGDGNSDIYRVRTNGSDLQEIVATSSMEDSAVLSPNGKQVAYVSTANGYKANVWIKDLESGKAWNITDNCLTASNSSLPQGYFRPSWSPDGEWVAFSSDRNSGWYGHGDPVFLGVSGWEHTQELSIYVIRPNGTEFRQIATKKDYSLGSPTWSPDGERILYYEMTREETWDAHRPESVAAANSTLVSVDFATGEDRKVEVPGTGVKTFGQYISKDNIGYLLRGGTKEGIYTSNGTYINTTNSTTSVRSPAWSPDGKKIVYEKTTWVIRDLEKKVYSWDDEWEYRFMDVFPQMSYQNNRIAYTSKQTGNSSIITIPIDGTEQTMVFDALSNDVVNGGTVAQGLAGAFQASWSTDGEWITTAIGSWFQTRAQSGGWLVRAAANGTYAEVLTNSSATLSSNSTLVNSGFPSFSRDGKKIVYRVWGYSSSQGDKSQLGLRVLDLETREETVLTEDWDNLPFFSPDGKSIVFTRKTSETNYDVCTIRPDGTDLKVLTSSGANDAHAVWSHDGRIMYSTGMYGFKYECALYDDTFQPYGQIAIMNADGSNKRMLTDSLWEDSMPMYAPNSK